MDKTKVCVICLTYNHEEYIAETLDGFLKQNTSFNVKYVIHDDASTDSTPAIMKEYEERYPGVFEMIYEKDNLYSQHIDFTSLYIMREVTAPYIALCEGDDYWIAPDKLQTQVTYMDLHPECSLTLHNGLRLSNTSHVMKPINPFPHEGNLSIRDVFLEPGGMPPTASMVFRSNIFKSVPTDVFRAPVGDRPYRMFLALNGDVYYFNRIMSVYRYDAPGSFGVRIKNDREYSRLLLIQMIDFYNRFDKYTDYKYHDIVNILISKENYLCKLRSGELIKAWLSTYYRKHVPIEIKVKDFMKIVLPDCFVDFINRAFFNTKTL